MSPNARTAVAAARQAAATAWDAMTLAMECLVVAVLTWWDTRGCPAEDGEEAFWDG